MEGLIIPKKVIIRVKKEPNAKNDEDTYKKLNKHRIQSMNQNFILTSLPSNVKESLMKAHFLAPPRLVMLSMRHHLKKHDPCLIKIPKKDSHVWEVYNKNTNAYEIVSQEFILDEIVFQAWKSIMQMYDELKQNDEYDSFMESLSDYVKYRIKQLNEDFIDFTKKSSSNNTWVEIRQQILEVILELFFPNNHQASQSRKRT